MPVLGTGALPAVGSSSMTTWGVAGPAYTNPRPATDILMSAYDTGQTDPAADIQTAINAAAAIAQQTGRARLLMNSRLKYVTAQAVSLGTDGQYGVFHVPADLTGRMTFLELSGLPGAGRVPFNLDGLGGGGTIIQSTVTAVPTWDGAKGLASLIGGPSSLTRGGGRTRAQLSGLNLSMKNLTVRLADNPPICGVDGAGMQGLEFDNVVWDTPQWASNPGLDNPAATWSSMSLPTNPMGVAFTTPSTLAQQNCRIGHVYVSGYTCAAYLNELVIAERIDVNGCNIALGLGTCYHPSRIGVLGDYDNKNGATGYDFTSSTFLVAPAAIGGKPPAYFLCEYWDKQPGNSQMSSSFNRQYDVYDPSNLAPIWAKLARVDANVGRVTGGHLIYGSGGLTGPWSGRITDLTSPPGVITNVTLPASTTAVRNPLYRDALVTVTGGTFTQVTINGTAAGTGGTYLVPASASISVTYSSAPTWVWQTV